MASRRARKADHRNGEKAKKHIVKKGRGRKLIVHGGFKAMEHKSGKRKHSRRKRG